MSFDDEMPSFAPRSNSAAFSPLEIAAEQTEILAKWLADHPVIQTEDESREAKLVYDRAYNAEADLEAVRDAHVKPLHTAWQAGIAKFKPTTEALSGAVQTLYRRMQTYLRKIEDEKLAAAEAARKAVFVAEMEARQKEAAEREAIENASQGEIGVDVVKASVEADQAFANFQAANKVADQAMRETNVRVTGGLGRAMGVRRDKTVVVDDAAKALAVLGVTEDIRMAIVKSARAWKKLNNKWPDGVHEEEV